MMRKSVGYTEGYEDYTDHYLYGSTLFRKDNNDCLYQYRFANISVWIPASTPDRIRIATSSSAVEKEVESHKTVIENAKTAYVHPSCKLPRTLLTQKYKKALDPWLADIVVVPKGYYAGHEKYLLFANDETMDVIRIYTDCWWGESDEIRQYFKELKEGDTIADLMRKVGKDIQSVRAQSPDIADTILNAKFQFYGIIMPLDHNTKWLIDYADNVIPKSKTVFEEDVLASLKSDSNKPTCEGLVSLAEMLDSTDHDTQTAALKALASLDYVNYPNSIVAVFKKAGSKWRDVKAYNNTDVKYMLEYLELRNSRYMVYKEKYISKDDYEVFLPLYKELFPNLGLENLPFMYADQEYVIHPRLKK